MIERLHDYEGPARAQTRKLADWEGRWEKVDFHWPTEASASPNAVAGQIRSIVADEWVQETGRPTLVVAALAEKAFRSNEHEFVASWFDGWDAALEGSTLRDPLLPILLINPKLGGWWGGSLKKINKVIADRGQQMAQQTCCPVLLPALEPISDRDAQSWSASLFGIQDVRTQVDMWVKDQFAGPKPGPLPMDTFADRVIRSPWFGQLKDVKARR